MSRQGREHELRVSPKGDSVAVKKKTKKTAKQNNPQIPTKLKRNKSTLKCKQRTTKKPLNPPQKKSGLFSPLSYPRLFN